MYPSPSADSDHALIAACCAGNKQAFDILALRYKDLVSRLALQLLRDPHEVENLTQDTFLQAYKKLTEFRGEAQFSTWLYRICCNLCLTHLKKQANDPISAAEAETLLEELPDPKGGFPDHAVMKRQRQKLVQQTLAQMTREFREVLLLHNRMHLSYAEIAQRLRLPVGTVRSRLHRGREELRKRLRPHL